MVNATNAGLEVKIPANIRCSDVQVKRIHAQVPSNSTTNLKEAIDRLSAESENLEKSVTEEDQ